MGISAALASLGSLFAGGASALGIGDATAALIGTGLADATAGAGVGALTSAVTGGDPGIGALSGGLSFGLGGVGGGLAGDVGLSAGEGAVLGGALGGLGASEISGTNPLSGALTGALSGYGANALNTPAVGAAGAAGGATPGLGGASAAGSSLSASGGGLPSGALGTDLTSAAPGIEQATVTANAIPSLSGAGLAGGAAGYAAGSSLAGNGGGTQSGNNVPNLYTPNANLPAGITQNAVQAAGSLAPNIGQINAALPSLGAAPVSDATSFLGKDSGILGLNNAQLLQGGIMGIQGVQQNNQLKSLLAPIQNTANTLNQQDAALSGALFGGQLPAGAQAAVQQSTQSQIAQIKSTYANLGLSGSTMEADAINQAHQQAAAQTFSIANQLFQEGQSGTQMSSNLYGQILNTQLSQDKELSDAIAGFAGSLMGNQIPSQGRTINLNLQP